MFGELTEEKFLDRVEIFFSPLRSRRSIISLSLFLSARLDSWPIVILQMALDQSRTEAISICSLRISRVRPVTSHSKYFPVFLLLPRRRGGITRRRTQPSERGEEKNG